MPFIQVTMLQGRTIEQKHALIKRLTEATAEALGSEPARIRVAIYEVSADEWGVGGEPISKARPQS